MRCFPLVMLATVMACADRAPVAPAPIAPDLNVGIAPGAGTPPAMWGYSEEYSWYSGQFDRTPMGSATNRTCVLTYVSGKFRGDTEWVWVYKTGGNWYLTGYSQQSGVSAKARCVSTLEETGEYMVSTTGPLKVAAIRALPWACGLTSVQGNFGTPNPIVSISGQGTLWTLKVSGGAISARARCFAATLTTTTAAGEWALGALLPTKLKQSADNFCFLTLIHGTFNTDTWAWVTPIGGYWRLYGQSTGPHLWARGTCVARP
jgi:hypothetical protein